MTDYELNDADDELNETDDELNETDNELKDETDNRISETDYELNKTDSGMNISDFELNEADNGLNEPIESLARQKRGAPPTPQKKRYLLFYIYFINGRYEEKKHYVIYDFNSFIADVGGYMGLLLGFNLHSIFEMAVKALKTITKKI